MSAFTSPNSIPGPVSEEFPTGTSVIDVVASILQALAPGAVAQILQFSAAPTAQHRTAEPDRRSEAIFERALTLRSDTGLPFWDAVFLTGELADQGVTPEIVEGALLHQSLHDAERSDVPIDADFAPRLRSLVAAPTSIVAFSSELRLKNGDVRHLPVLDFASKSRRPGAAVSAITVARSLGVPGFILRSGRSFHFYGAVLLDADELQRFLCRALLLAPVTDARWIAHQLLDGKSSLRISPNGDGGAPSLIARV